MRIGVIVAAVGGPIVAGVSLACLRIKVASRRNLPDGDRYEAEEMLAAFGTTQEWV